MTSSYLACLAYCLYSIGSLQRTPQSSLLYSAVCCQLYFVCCICQLYFVSCICLLYLSAPLTPSAPLSRSARPSPHPQYLRHPLPPQIEDPGHPHHSRLCVQCETEKQRNSDNNPRCCLPTGTGGESVIP